MRLEDHVIRSSAYGLGDCRVFSCYGGPVGVITVGRDPDRIYLTHGMLNSPVHVHESIGYSGLQHDVTQQCVIALQQWYVCLRVELFE